jgi:hypothetical protein
VGHSQRTVVSELPRIASPLTRRARDPHRRRPGAFLTHHPTAPRGSTSSLADLLAAANELLQVLAHLIPTHPLPGRAAHGLINVVADLFASADAADMLASVDSTRVALSLRNTCVGVVRALEPELVLRALLRRGADIAGASAASQDPARRAQHALSLVDLVLPLEPDAPGADVSRRALPRILPELAAFFRVLDVDGRAHLVRRLAEFRWRRAGPRGVARS